MGQGKFFQKKISGNSLIITIIIGLVLAILCSSLLLLFYYNRLWQSQVKIDRQLERNIQSGINLLLSDTSTIFVATPDTIDLFGDAENLIKTERERWGLFYIGLVEAYAANTKKAKLFLYGSKPEKYYDGCIYLADHQEALSLIGDTRLTGDAYLSGGGIKPGYINQRGYSFSRLLAGSIQRSKRDLPALNENTLEYLLALEKSTGDTSFLKSMDIIESDTLERSFGDTALTFFQHRRIVVAGKYLKGKIIIKSDSAIEVAKSAGLENVILVAPEIRFDAGFSGTVQAVATDSIIAEAGTSLHYPSSLVLVNNGNSIDGKRINIEKDCKLEGIILSIADSAHKQKTFVNIRSGTIITGIVYASGFLENLATIQGTALTDLFIYRNGASVYVNNLVDVEINRNLLSKYFISSPIFGNKKNNILAWVK